MVDTLSIALDPETTDQLRRAAEERGESLEVLASRLLQDAAAELTGEHPDTLLSAEQLADLKRRVENPGPLATDEEVEAFFARFRD